MAPAAVLRSRTAVQCFSWEPSAACGYAPAICLKPRLCLLTTASVLRIKLYSLYAAPPLVYSLAGCAARAARITPASALLEVRARSQLWSFASVAFCLPTVRLILALVALRRCAAQWVM